VCGIYLYLYTEQKIKIMKKYNLTFRMKTITKIPKEQWGVHSTHCCVTHGCKYGDSDCPVVTNDVIQKYTCEDCQEDYKEPFSEKMLNSIIPTLEDMIEKQKEHIAFLEQSNNRVASFLGFKFKLPTSEIIDTLLVKNKEMLAHFETRLVEYNEYVKLKTSPDHD